MVVVAFNPDAGLVARLRATKRQASTVLVADNSDTPQGRAETARMSAEAEAEHLPQASNRGIAGALNAGFAILRSRGFTHALALDQDSMPEGDLAASLLAAATPDQALVGADWFDHAAPERAPRHVVALRWMPLLFRRRPLSEMAHKPGCRVPVSFAIMSGACIPLEAWHKLGGFNEDLMLDLVDEDFCLRAREAGLGVSILPGARLEHRRGNKRRVHTPFGTFIPAFIPPRRLRCMFRNRTRVLFRWMLRHPHMASYELAFSAKLVADIILLEDFKAAKLRAIAAGILDAVRGRPPALGSSPPPTPRAP